MDNQLYLLKQAEYNLQDNKQDAVFLQHRNKISIRQNKRELVSYDKSYKSKVIFDGELSKKEVMKFFSIVRKSVDKYILKNDFNVEPISQIASITKSFNYEIFKNIPNNHEFWIFDLNNAYWQMMYRMGIIDKSIYLKYRNDANYKLLKQVAIGLINEPKKARFMRNGKFVKDKDGRELLIVEDNKEWRIVYSNVRLSCYNVPISIIQELKNNYIFFNQDAVAVTLDLEKKVREYMELHDLDYKMQLCVKLNDYEYMQGDKLRKAPIVSMEKFLA